MGYLSPGQQANLVADGGYILAVAPPPQLAATPTSNVIAIVGGATGGKPNFPYRVSLRNGSGPMTAAIGSGVANGAYVPFAIAREVLSAIPEATEFVFIRAVDGTQAFASCNITDATGFATGNVTYAGTTAGVGQVSTLTIVNGAATVAVVYNPVSGVDTPTTTAAAMAALANASAAVIGATPFMAKYTSVAGVMTGTALVAGTAGNAITQSLVTTGTGITSTPVTATAMAGGAVPGIVSVLTDVNPGTNGNGMYAQAVLQSGTTALNPVYRVAVSYPFQGSVVYGGIIGYATIGGAYNAAAFQANLNAAVNGTAANRVASLVVVATSGASTLPPSTTQTFIATGGADGTAGLGTAQLFGVDGTSNRTGMYALRGQSFRCLLFGGTTDPTIASTMSTFLNQVGGIGLVGFPSGSSTAATVATCANYNIKYPRIIPVEDWCYYPDVQLSSQSVLVSPLGAAAGILASLAPWQDPSNKPQGATKGGILGTERTISSQPIDPQSEGAQRKSNGISYLTNGQPRTGGLFGLAHGLASDGSNIADTLMFDFVASKVLAILQYYVGAPQTPPVTSGLETDPTRLAINGQLAQLKQDLIGTANSTTQSQTTVGPTGQKLAAFRYYSVASAAQVAAGFAIYQIFGTTLAGIQFAIGQLSIGTTVPTS